MLKLPRSNTSPRGARAVLVVFFLGSASSAQAYIFFGDLLSWFDRVRDAFEEAFDDEFDEDSEQAMADLDDDSDEDDFEDDEFEGDEESLDGELSEEGGGDSTDPNTGGGSQQDGGPGHGNGGMAGAGSHCAMEPSFVSLSQVTHAAVRSGAWTDPQTWGGQLPGNGAFVRIPEGVDVIIDSSVQARLETVRIDGSLRFAPTVNTQLQVDTLFSSCSGSLEIGTAEQPIQDTVNARVVFVDNGLISDPDRLSRGAVLMGRTRIYGNAKTHRTTISPHATEGDSVLNLGEAPTGWQPGDELIITGTVPNDPRSDEIRSIRAISGARVTLDLPLSIDHRAPQADLNVYVANSSRNVEFVSENPAINRRGHIMMMSADVVIQNARFTELGRTDKSREVDDFFFEFDDGGVGDNAPATARVTPLFGSNVRGRYALHFHRVGTNPSSAPALVQGSVAVNGPGWGFVNHSSHVNFINNVAYGFQGAGFYTEAGDEIGSMQGNIAIRSVNSTFNLGALDAIDPDIRANRMDYGHNGDGFWLTGNRVSLINNVSAGSTAHGIVYWTDGIMEPTRPMTTRATVAVADLPNGNLILGRDRLQVWWAPFAESRGNESYGSVIGFRIRYVHAENYLDLGNDASNGFHLVPPQSYIDTLSPTVSDLTVWGNRDGVLLNYNERMSLIGARIVGFGRGLSRFSFNPGTAKAGIGLDIGNDATHGPSRIENVTIEGFGMGLAAPVNGRWDLNQMRFIDNETDVLFLPAESSPTNVVMQNVEFESFDVVDGTSIPRHISINR